MKELTFLNNKKIDRKLWDKCVANSHNSLPYGLSWYLDAVAENWDGLVLGNYEAVMPLVWLRKLGVKCLYQPYYCQQTGVFSPQPLNHENLQGFFAYCKANFLYVNVNLNSSNHFTEKGFLLKHRKNLLLTLSDSYETIRKRYSVNHRRNISKAAKGHLEFEFSADEKKFINFYLTNINHQKETFKSQHEKIFRKLTGTLLKSRIGTIAVVKNAENEWLAASLLIHHGHRLINIINTSSALGKSKGASHFLFDNIIQQNVRKNLVLDFEGSSIPSIARFYDGFGAKEETFYNFHYMAGGLLSQLFK